MRDQVDRRPGLRQLLRCGPGLRPTRSVSRDFSLPRVCLPPLASEAPLAMLLLRWNRGFEDQERGARRVTAAPYRPPAFHRSGPVDAAAAAVGPSPYRRERLPGPARASVSDR